ncbi:MAG: hypothetical protein FJ026_02410 [Chloroflexi bacterium]|nr:hypothetical protein [Chloroflexota bacterium]
MTGFLLDFPLFAAYLLGCLLTLFLVIKRRNPSSVLGFLGFFFLLAVHIVLPLFVHFATRLHGRGLPLIRVSVITGLAQLALNLVSAAAVLCIVGAIALSARSEDWA